MSLGKISKSELTIERALGGKRLIDERATTAFQTTHPEANMYRADHQKYFFCGYWRQPLEPKLKHVVDPTAKRPADLADREKMNQEDAELVKQLGAKDNENSDDKVETSRAGPRKTKK